MRTRPSGRARTRPYFVILQSHHLSDMDSVVVAPVLRDAKRAMSVLDVEIEAIGEGLVVALGELFSIDRTLLKAAVGSARPYEDLLRRGFDRLFTGF